MRKLRTLDEVVEEFGEKFKMDNNKLLKLYDALKHITEYIPPAKLHRIAEKQYGLSGEEAIEMAYENVLQEARIAIKGMKVPIPKNLEAIAEANRLIDATVKRIRILEPESPKWAADLLNLKKLIK